MNKTILLVVGIAVIVIVSFLVFGLKTDISGNVISDTEDYGGNKITLKVAIPCPGHAGLIEGELKKLNGVEKVDFRFPNYFDVYYSGVSEKEILNLGIFGEYPASIQ